MQCVLLGQWCLFEIIEARQFAATKVRYLLVFLDIPVNQFSQCHPAMPVQFQEVWRLDLYFPEIPPFFCHCIPRKREALAMDSLAMLGYLNLSNKHGTALSFSFYDG